MRDNWVDVLYKFAYSQLDTYEKVSIIRSETASSLSMARQCPACHQQGGEDMEETYYIQIQYAPSTG